MENMPIIPSKEQLIELTQIQKSLWIGQQLSPFSPLYNMAFSFEFFTEIQVEKFQKAFQLLIQESDAMRSCFVEMNGTPKQQIREVLTYQMECLDFSDKNNPKLFLKDWLVARVKKVFNIKNNLFDSVLLKLDTAHYVWYLNQHHLITDGWSKTIQYQRMLTLYQHLLKEENELVSPLSPFVTYVKHEIKQKEKLKTSIKSYWENKIKNFPTLPSLYYKQNPLSNTFTYRKTEQLDSIQTANLHALMGNPHLRTWSKDLSLFLFFSTILYLTILKISGQSNLTIGTPVHNRNHPNFKKTIGVFIELFPLQITIQAGDTFQSLFERVRDAYYEFMRYAQTGSSSTTLNKTFNVVLNYINTTFPAFEEGQVVSKWLDTGHADSNHHLKLQIFDFDASGSITLMFDGNNAIFREEQLHEGAEYFMEMVAIYSSNQLLPIQILTHQETEKLQEFNDTIVDFPVDKTIVDLFEEKAIQYPDNTAVIFENEKMTFHQLNEKSNQLAHYLLSLGVQTEDLVAICLDRSFEMMIGLIGILKSGAAYVPIDTTYPKNRIDYTLEDAQVAIVICTTGYASLFEGKNVKIISLDEAQEKISNYPITAPIVSLSPQNLMYVIYTSGSTGRPKGVMNEHGGLVNRLLWAQQYFNITANSDVFLQKTTFCFDVSVWELFLPLISGNSLVMARPEGHKDSVYLQSIITEQAVTIVHFVPPMLEVFLLDTQVGDCPMLKKVICSGEALKGQQIELFQQKLPRVELYNLYGPTEAAIDVSTYKVPPIFNPSNTVPIGKPIANTALYIVNELGMACPIGVAGELYIGGIQVARGYHNKPKLTEERFIEHTFLKNKKQRLYKTGDLAKWMPDGNIQFLGRLDTQVKIRGFRIEISEVEVVLNKIKGVQQSTVLVKTDQFGNNYLAAYFVGESNVTTKTVTEALKKELPSYMIPTHFIQLEALPISINGKLNRAALPTPIAVRTDNNKYIAPRNEFETIVQDIWSEVLEIESISVFDHFLEIGGESLRAIRVINRLRTAFELDLPTKLIFNESTIEKQAKYIEATIVEMLEGLENEPN